MAKTPVEVLRSIDILCALSADDLNRLYSLMKTEEYQEGNTLFREGDTGEIMYIVLSGCVSISVGTQDGGVLELAERKLSPLFEDERDNHVSTAYRRQRAAWHRYYDALDAAEEHPRSDATTAAREIVARCRLS